MDEAQVAVCAASELVDGGLAVKLPVLHAGQAATAFFVRYGGQVYGYLNRCPHMGSELDWENSVFTRAGDLLMCARHGATFEPDTGVCVGGPCRSSVLHRLDVAQEAHGGEPVVVWRPSGKTGPVPAQQILRADMAHLNDAQQLLSEYFEAIGVMQRDTPQDVAAYLEGQDACIWIAYVRGVPAGCVALRPLAFIDQAAECKRLYVRPQFRGLGLAQALLDALEQHADQARYEWIYLDSKDDLVRAIQIYVGRGYQPCERYNDNPQASVFFRKKLGD